MDATTIVVIVLVALFFGAMIAFQVYMNSGKDKETDSGKTDRR